MGSVRAADVGAAVGRLRGCVHRTPVLTCGALERLAGRRLLFKCELFQRTGSFKIRGALNAVRSLVEEAERAGRERPRAVVTHSSGNHGQALACAAREEGIPAYIVVPRTAPCCKQAAIRAYGATLVPCEPSDESRAETAARVVQETGGIMVHPNQEPAVIAGQGTIALEVLEQVPEVNALVVPVGGGGMIAGIAVAVKALRPDVKVFAAEPRNADDCYQSKLRGELTPNRHTPDTIADAVKTSIGENTWPIIRDLVDDVLTVSEEEIKGKPCTPQQLCKHQRCFQLEKSWRKLCSPSPKCCRARCTCGALHSPRGARTCCRDDSCCSVPTASHTAGVGKDEAAD